MWLPWDYAALAAVAVGGLGLVARSARRSSFVAAGALARETALVLILYSIWQLAGRLSVMQVSGAMGRGRWLWDVEQNLHFPSELRIQRAVLPHHLVVQVFNGYYAVAHVPALIIFLIWLFVYHRDRYTSARNVIAFVTGTCLLIQLIPVAPPRMFPALGFVDTAKLYGQSVYGAVGSGISDQLSAMPSVHVGWAVIVGVGAVLIGRSRWRWLALVHSVLTSVVVVATANHWWLDGVVAVALIGAALAVDRAARVAFSAARARWRSAVVPVSQPAYDRSGAD